MAYALLVKAEVKKIIDRLSPKDRARVEAAFNEIARNPQVGKKLLSRYPYVYSVQMVPFRILYFFRAKDLVIISLHKSFPLSFS